MDIPEEIIKQIIEHTGEQPKDELKEKIKKEAIILTPSGIFVSSDGRLDEKLQGAVAAFSSVIFGTAEHLTGEYKESLVCVVIECEDKNIILCSFEECGKTYIALYKE